MERKFQWNHQPFADVDAYEIGIISGLLMSMNTAFEINSVVKRL